MKGVSPMVVLATVCVSHYPWLRVIFQLMTTPLTTRFVHCKTFYCVYKDIAIYIIYIYIYIYTVI